jgi:hypothetical protein
MTDTAHRGAHELTQKSGRGTQRAEVASTARDIAPRAGGGSHPRCTVLRLYARLIRRGALLMAVGMAAYVGFEVASYSAAYPNGVSATQFAMFQDNPAVRMMQGVPNALDSAGGFTVWDGGWFFQLLLAVWALLTTSRLLRGEEDVERTDLVLAGPVRATRATALSLVVVAAAALLVGLAVTVTMLASGTGLQGSALLGLGATLAAHSSRPMRAVSRTCGARGPDRVRLAPQPGRPPRLDPRSRRLRGCHGRPHQHHDPLAGAGQELPEDHG